LALRSRIEPNWAKDAAPRKIIVAKTHPILLTVKGIERIPEPITVLMMVVIVRPRSAYFLFTSFGDFTIG